MAVAAAVLAAGSSCWQEQPADCSPSFLVLETPDGNPSIGDYVPPQYEITAVVFGCREDLASLSSDEIELLRSIFRSSLQDGVPFDVWPGNINDDAQERDRIAAELNLLLGREVITDVMIPTAVHNDYFNPTVTGHDDP